MTDFFDRVLARAGCPPPEADVVRARPRGPEPFEGERGTGRLPVLDETTLAPFRSGTGRPPDPADPFVVPQTLPAPPGTSPVASGSLPGPAERDPGVGVGVDHRSVTVVEKHLETAVHVPERIEIHELRTESVRTEPVPSTDRLPGSPPVRPAAPSRPPAPSVPAPVERGERPPGRRERLRRPEPVVEVRIGRIEVVAAATAPEPAPVRGRSRPEPQVSLDEYLSAAP